MPAGSTYSTISTTTLGSNQVNFTFSSIPGTYTDLVVIYQAKSYTSGFDAYLRFNSDTGSNYSATYLSGTGSAAQTGRQTSQTSMLLDNYGSIPTTEFNMTRLSVMNYANTTTNKTVLIRSDRASSGTDVITGLWRSTTAITSMTILGDFATGSTFTIYGIAAA
jgi:hypothetical protein